MFTFLVESKLLFEAIWCLERDFSTKKFYSKPMYCFAQQSKLTIEITNFFNKNIDHKENIFVSDYIDGVSFTNLPIVRDNKLEIITTSFTLGLLPTHRDKDFRKSTLNVQVETLKEKPSFAPSINKRCLVIVSPYYHWNDAKGKSKTKYQINCQEVLSMQHLKSNIIQGAINLGSQYLNKTILKYIPNITKSRMCKIIQFVKKRATKE